MTLPPLRWLLEQPGVYDEESRTIHRPDCRLASGRPLQAGEVLETAWAPLICSERRPDVLMKLGC